MKQLLLVVFMSTFAFSGFYGNTDEAALKKSEYVENERLCKMFTKKVEVYKSGMRDDELAAATLASYQHRADIYCKKVEDAKKSL